jgi:Na+-translocating ferredoxin:NAD+ oxidoreductase subunit E
MREELNKSLLITAPLPLLGIGIIAPLSANGSLRMNALLGLVAVASLVVSNVIIACAGQRVPANARGGIAMLIAGGVLTLAKISVEIVMPIWQVPVETLAPLLVMSAVIAVDSKAYAVKKKEIVVLFDAFGIGLGFTLLLSAAGELCTLAGTGGVFAFFNTCPGVFSVAAIIILGSALFSHRTGEKETV